MKAFHFSLQAVLDQYKREEELAQIDFAAMLKNLQGAEQRILDHQNEVNRLLSENTLHSEKKVDVNRMIDARRFIETLYLELIKFRKGLAFFQEQVRLKQQKLVKIAQKHQALVKLKDKQFDAWSREMLRLEQTEMDEIAGNISRRQLGRT